jgi:hypothetical protein
MDLLNNLLSNDSYTPVNKDLAKKIWFVVAWFLWELIRQRKRFWLLEFYITQSEIEKEIWLTPFQQRECIKELKKHWLLDVIKKWIPCKNWYKINDDSIITVLSTQMWRNLTTWCEDSWQQDINKLDDYSNIYFNKNNNKNNNKETLTDFEKTLVEFKEFRKSKKDPLTDYAEKLLLWKLNKWYWDNEELKIKTLEESIINWRKWIFELKDNKNYNTSKPKTITYEEFEKKMMNWEYNTLKEQIWKEKFFKYKNIYNSDIKHFI